MNRAFPTEFTDAPQSLPSDQLGKNAKAAVTELAEKGYHVRIGLSEQELPAILALSQEPTIREYCPNDSAKRFTDKYAASRWLSKGRLAFLLFNDIDNHLAGYGWCGPEEDPKVPGSKTTFALRVGPADQGRGLATPYSMLMLAATFDLYQAEDFSLEAWASNGGAVHIYHKLGFQDVAEDHTTRLSANGDMVEDIRFHMSLPNELLR